MVLYVYSKQNNLSITPQGHLYKSSAWYSNTHDAEGCEYYPGVFSKA